MATVLCVSMMATLCMPVSAKQNTSISSPLKSKAEIISNFYKLSDGKLQADINQGTGKLFISGKLSEQRQVKSEDAISYLQENKNVLNLGDNQANFNVVSQTTDDLGFTHIKLNQLMNGLPIRDKQIIVHYKGNAVVAVNGEVESNITSTTRLGNKNISQNEAILIAEGNVDKADLKVGNIAKEVCIKANVAYEVYNINISSNKSKATNMNVLVEVTSGNIIDKISNVRKDGAVTGSGTLVDGSKKSINVYQTGSSYSLKDTTKPMTGTIQTYTSKSTNKQPGTLITSASTVFSDKAAVSAHYYAGVVYDFYKNLFNRNSIDNKQMSIISSVHYLEDGDINNAYWTGNQMCYADGDGKTFLPFSADLDVVGHELTHGVDQYTANLNYLNQSGALNESMSDVMGVLIDSYDKYNVKAGGTWTFDPADWQIGQKIYVNQSTGNALRSLVDPTLFSQPANMSGYVNTTQDEGGVHTNSGIPNKAAYLIAKVVGCEKTAKIYYRGMVNYMIASTNFVAARSAILQAATDLYGASGAEVAAVKSAFDTVGIYGSDTPIPTPTPTPSSYEPNDTISAAYPIVRGKAYTDTIRINTDVDWYKLPVTATGYLYVNLTTLPADYDLYLYNASGTLIAQSTNSNTKNEAISYNVKTKGNYYIKVVGYGGAYNATKAYTLTTK